MRESEYLTRVEEIFYAAIKLGDEERAAFLSHMCASDDELRSDVESLIRAHEEPGDFLDTPPSILTAGLLEDFDMEVGQSIGRYRILAPIGQGGMGCVYKAEDPSLLRAVAIKVISKHRFESQAEVRFLREARATSAINHPNVITIHEIGTTPTCAYIVMEYVEGCNLAELIAQSSMGTDRFFDIAFQISDGIYEAHSKGIIHRDIKPENVLITGHDRVKLLDFGIAKHLNSAWRRSNDSTAMESITKTGVLIGTPAYMSPEQLRGDQVDERTDVFSFGVLLYKMITGEHPFSGSTPIEVAASILKDEPSRTINAVNNLPPQIVTLVLRCLEKKPDSRYRSFDEIKRELSASRQQCLSMSNDAMRAVSSSSQANPFEPARKPLSQGLSTPTILVLPFEVLGSNEDRSFIGLGMAYALRTTLSRIKGLSVLSQVTDFIQAESAEQSLRIAQRAGATILLEGEVMCSGPQLEVRARLIEVDSSYVIWGERYRGASSDLFRIQDSLCDGVAVALKLNIASQARTKALPVTADIEAFECYSMGRAYLEQYYVKENIDAAIRTLEQATKLDERFALPYASLGEAYWRKYVITLDYEWVRRAIAASDRALVLDPEQSLVHVSLGYIYYSTRNIDAAIREFELALEIQPVCDDAFRRLGKCYQVKGDLQTAVSYFEKAMEIRPRYWDYYNGLGLCYYTFAQYDRAAEMFRRVIELQPDNYNGYNNLGAIYYLRGQYQDALVMHQRAIEIQPSEEAYSNLGTDYFYTGCYEKAVESYKSAINISPNNDLLYINLGDAYLRQNRKSDADEQYEKARQLLVESLRARQENAQLQSRLALCHAKLGRHDEAHNTIERALKIEPRNTTVIYRRATVYALTGKIELAIESLREALALGYSCSEAMHDPNFESLRQHELFNSLVDPVS
jgi:non-specific serine/threonine protein kinase